MFFWWKCISPWASSSHTVGVIIRQHSFSHGGRQEWQTTHFHKLLKSNFCSAIGSSCWTQQHSRVTISYSLIFYSPVLKKSESFSLLPLPMMTKGLLAAFKTDIASVIALWSAKLTGGGGQQETSLQDKHTSLTLFALVNTQVMYHRKFTFKSVFKKCQWQQTWLCSCPHWHWPCPLLYPHNKHQDVRTGLCELPTSNQTHFNFILIIL